MYRILLLAGIVGALLTEGCATIPLNEARLDSYVVCDVEFIARVEHEAKRRGTAIRWMRCPQLSPTPPPYFHFGDRREA